jgi:hypothetical protein
VGGARTARFNWAFARHQKCGTVSPRSPSLGFILGAVAGWVILVTVLHTAINGRVSLAPGAEARTLQVGGLPVT